MRTRSHWIRWGVTLAAGLSVVGIVWVPPVVDEPIRSVIMRAFSGLCHQLPARSFHVGGIPLAVCDRCLGIYSGVLLGVLLLPLMVTTARWLHRNVALALAVALVPLAIDWVGPVMGGWGNVPLSRIATGAVFGIAAGLLVTYAVVSAGRRATESATSPGDPSRRNCE